MKTSFTIDFSVEREKVPFVPLVNCNPNECPLAKCLTPLGATCHALDYYKKFNDIICPCLILQNYTQYEK